MKEVKKIVIIGGESTGKSTLCAQLALQFETTWVAEYARTYLENLNRAYVYEDLLIMAKGQLIAEEMEIAFAKKYLFCDTDLNVLKVWSEHKYQRCDKYLLAEISKRKYDGYILMAPDFPWEKDPLREHPEPQMRSYFFELYKNILENTHVPFCIAKGNSKKRIEIATAFLSRLNSPLF